MKPLIVLILVFLLSALLIRLVTQKYDVLLAARIGMCAMLFFTAVGHFAFTKGMAMMLPPIVPLKNAIIYLTGLLEILLGVGLLIPRLTVYSGWLLIAFLSCYFLQIFIQVLNKLTLKKQLLTEIELVTYGFESLCRSFLLSGHTFP